MVMKIHCRDITAHMPHGYGQIFIERHGDYRLTISVCFLIILSSDMKPRPIQQYNTSLRALGKNSAVQER